MLLTMKFKKQIPYLILLLSYLSLASNLAFAELWNFEKTINYAKNHGPEVEIAKERIKIAKAQLGQARATYWPKLQFQTGYSQTDSPLYSFGNILIQKNFSPTIDFNNVPTTDNYNAKAIATLTLYSGGKNSAQLEGAKANLEDSLLEKRIVENDFSTQVALTFLELKKISEVVASMESSVKAFEANEKSVQGRFSAGTALKTELLDIQVQLENAKEELVRIKNAKMLAKQSLKNLLAIEEEPFELDLNSANLVEPLNDMEDSERLEAKSMKTKIKSAKAQIKEAVSGYLPRVSLQGAYDYSKGWEIEGDGNNYTVGVVGEWDLWDGLLTSNREKEAKAQHQLLKQQEVRLKENLSYELSQAKIKLSEAKEALSIARKAQGLAKESAELSRMRFAQGLASSTQLIDAEHAYTASSVRKAQAEVEVSIAVLLLRRANNLGPIDFNEGD